MKTNYNHLFSILILFALGCSQPKEKAKEVSETKTEEVAPNQLTEAEKAEGWKLLFDGKSTKGWHKFKTNTIGKKWKAQDGALYFVGDEENEDEATAAEGGDILTDDEFTNYELNLEWKISPGGNSGIIYNVIESDEYNAIWHTGPEMQVLDNERHADGQIKTHRAGDLYDMISCSQENVNPVGEWNKIRLIINQGKLEHWMNGVKVVEIEMWTPEWNELVANSKFNDKPAFGTAKKGRIALQDHNDPVWFRNIKIREL